VKTGDNPGTIRDQQQWSLQQCADVFSNSLTTLKEDLAKQGEDGSLVWDKVSILFYILKLLNAYL